MGKPNLRSLTVKAEQKCGSGTSYLWKFIRKWTSHLWKFWSKRCGSGTWDLLKSLPNRSLESRISHLCQSRQSGIVEAKLQTFRSRGRAEERNVPCVTWWVVKAQRRCGSGTSHHWSQGSVEALLQIFGRYHRAEVRKRNFRSLAAKQSGSAGAELQIFGSPVKLEVRKLNLISLTGPYPADCHWQFDE